MIFYVEDLLLAIRLISSTHKLCLMLPYDYMMLISEIMLWLCFYV